MADGCFELPQRVFRQFDDRGRVATIKQSRNRLGYLKNATGIVVRGMVVDKAVGPRRARDGLTIRRYV